MYQNEQAIGDELGDFNLDKLLEGLTSAKENLRGYVEPEGELPEGLQLAEGFYHVAAAVTLLGDPEVLASVQRILSRRRIAMHEAEAPAEQMELVGEPL